jgi:hypothetical protein
VDSHQCVLCSAEARAKECELARECAEHSEQEARAEAMSCRQSAESTLALNQQLTLNNIQLSTENAEVTTKVCSFIQCKYVNIHMI